MARVKMCCPKCDNRVSGQTSRTRCIVAPTTRRDASKYARFFQNTFLTLACSETQWSLLHPLGQLEIAVAAFLSPAGWLGQHRVIVRTMTRQKPTPVHLFQRTKLGTRGCLFRGGRIGKETRGGAERTRVRVRVRSHA